MGPGAPGFAHANEREEPHRMGKQSLPMPPTRECDSFCVTLRLCVSVVNPLGLGQEHTGTEP
jgi:hypothetical protein